MPYIKPYDRTPFDPILKELAQTIKSNSKLCERQGNLNYCISTLIHLLYEMNYNELNSAIGVLECAKLELYRKIIGPYEEDKILDNGDIVPVSIPSKPLY